ncbi:MAG: hypothetical protein AB1Z98_40505 [Nannocystaceae bacterium]
MSKGPSLRTEQAMSSAADGSVGPGPVELDPPEEELESEPESVLSLVPPDSVELVVPVEPEDPVSVPVSVASTRVVVPGSTSVVDDSVADPGPLVVEPTPLEPTVEA